MKWLICIAGGIASGKTTLAETLQASLSNAKSLAFGDFVRQQALARDLEPSRRTLQEVGLDLIANGWPAFVGGLLSNLTNDPPILIVEGIRHKAAVRVLKEQLPDRQALLVYVFASAEVRRQRMAERAEAGSAMAHAVEAEVEDLYSVADIVVAAQDPVRESVNAVTKYMLSRSD